MRPAAEVALLFLFLHTCDALYYSASSTSNRAGTNVGSYGFESGGTVTLTSLQMDPNINSNPPIYIFVCTDVSSIVRSNSIDGGVAVCSNPWGLCEAVDYIDSETWQGYTVRGDNLYTIYIMNCVPLNQTAVQINAEFLCLNPGNEQLEYGEQQMPTISIIFTALWSITLCIYTIRFCLFTRKIPLQKIMFFLIIFYLALVSVDLRYWSECKKTGMCPDSLVLFRNIARPLIDAALFWVIIYISKGWGITRPRIPNTENRTAGLSVLFLLAGLMIFSFLSRSYYFLSIVIIYLVLMPRVFTSASYNRRALESQLYRRFFLQSNGQQVSVRADTHTNVIVDAALAFRGQPPPSSPPDRVQGQDVLMNEAVLPVDDEAAQRIIMSDVAVVLGSSGLVEVDYREVIMAKLTIFVWLRRICIFYLMGLLFVNSVRIILNYKYNYLNYIFDQTLVLIVCSLIARILVPRNHKTFARENMLHDIEFYGDMEEFFERNDITFLTDTAPVQLFEPKDGISQVIVLEYPGKVYSEDAISGRTIAIALLEQPILMETKPQEESVLRESEGNTV